MIQLIIGGKGSGKTKKMIDMINESAKTTPGNIVCIEKSMKLTYDIDHNARLIDVDEYKIEGYEMLYGLSLIHISRRRTALQSGPYLVTQNKAPHFVVVPRLASPTFLCMIRCNL